MKISILLFAFLLAFFFTAGGAIYSQDKPEKKIESTYEKGSGDDANVKSKEKKNDPNDQSKIPDWKDETSKGSGSGTCKVIVQNYTPWYIDIYIDGYYEGTLGPWEDRYTYTGTGKTKVYGKAEMNDGSYVYWGPKLFDCEYRYTWTFNRP